MPMDVNSAIATATIITDGNGTGQDTGHGTPTFGVNLKIQVTSLIGNPNALFYVQTSADNSQWFDSTFDEFGPVNTKCERIIHFASKLRYWRLAWRWMSADPQPGSHNSSSLSAQSFNSSSSGGAASLTFNYGLVASNTGL